MNDELTQKNEQDCPTPADPHIAGKSLKNDADEKQIANMDYADFVSLLRESRII